jgi:hypothetical protein
MSGELGGGAAVALDEALARYDVPLFADPDLRDEVREKGFAQRPPILDAADVAELDAQAHEFLERLGEPCGDLFLTVGRSDDLALRAEMIERAGAVVLPKLRPWFVDGTQFLASGLQVKPPSPQSALNPHQDSSLVDEHVWPGIYAWIPLVHTDVRNGGLHVVPGSHRFGNAQRTLQVPWQFEGHEELLWRHSVPLEVPAGGVVFFDSALIHSSPPNQSGELRFALNNFARPAGAPLLHWIIDEQTTPGMVDVFEIDRSFLYGEDIMVRPGPPHRALGERPHEGLHVTADELEQLCLRAAGELAR